MPIQHLPQKLQRIFVRCGYGRGRSGNVNESSRNGRRCESGMLLATCAHNFFTNDPNSRITSDELLRNT